MCMCSGSEFYPPTESGIFFKMRPGDEIKIRPGFGYPQAEAEVTEILAAVDGYSALTASGRRLMCDDAYGLELTGNHFEAGEYEVSPETQEILAEVEKSANRDDSDSGWGEKDWLPHH